jgi:hypothetical protein
MTLLSGHMKRKKIVAALDKLTDNVGDAYDGVMGRIYDQDEDRRTIAITALKWITYANKRLTIDQLQHAIELGLDPDCNDIDNDDLVDPDQVLSCCAGLLILNQEDRTIRLVHYTTQDYIETQFLQLDAHTSLAKFCLTYLAFNEFVNPPKDYRELGEFIRPYPLCRYAATYWGYHAGLGAEKNLVQAILSTLATQTTRDMIETLNLNSWDYAVEGKTLLHLTSQHGLSQTSSAILNDHVRSPNSSETHLTN